MKENGRNLTPEEIAQLQAQGCSAADWNLIRVSERFQAHSVREVDFSGSVYLGCFSGTKTLAGGVTVACGIRKARVHSCCIGDDVLLEGVGCLAGYEVADGVLIENVHELIMEGESTFGTGTPVSVLDETGGKAVLLYEGLSAHTAWLQAMYAHRNDLRTAIGKLVSERADALRSSQGYIGEGASIRNAGTLRNLRVGAGCVIDGAARLEEGNLCSAPSAEGLTAAYVGSGVIARHFIFAPGVIVKDGAQLEHAFVGEAAELSKGFSAHDSLFFANCQMENGEACATFAGPYTVSMHKATLMVGGMFSFCNLGSGSNQSNHFYKLGPMHSGVCERGCKTGSDSYILWPGRIGAFTFIKGRHMSNPDTSGFPFSYLLEEGGTSYLSPAASLRSVGTLRDELKWPQRDKRKNLTPADQLCFEVLNPNTIRGIRKALVQMDNLLDGSEATEFPLTGAVLRKSSMVKGRKLYQSALDIYRGDVLVKKLELLKQGEALPLDVVADEEEWQDLSGLLVPESQFSALLHSLGEGCLENLSELEGRWKSLRAAYPENVWQNLLGQLAEEWGKSANAFTQEDFLSLIDRWETAQVGLYPQMASDADLELTMMHRYANGGEKPGHAFLDVLRKLTEEVPVRAARCREKLQAIG